MFISRIFVFALKQIHFVGLKQKSVKYHDWMWRFGQDLFNVLKKSRKLILNTSMLVVVGGGNAVQISFKLKVK